jgi:MoxR-like ATPase
VQLGPLGRAIVRAGHGRRSMVLIDEIDKADIDFPNDLLREVEAKEFTIEELDEQSLTDEDQRNGFRKHYQGARPIIVITSNDEKELPDAFLRRCLFYWIEFPLPDRLLEIVRVNEPDLVAAKQILVERAIARMNELRKIDGVRKKPATGELLDWVCILEMWEADPDDLTSDRQLEELPHWELLYKHQADLQRVRRLRQGDAVVP